MAVLLNINPSFYRCQTLQEVQLEGDCVQDGTLGLVAHDLNAGDLGQQAVIQDALVSDVQLQSTLNQQVGQNMWNTAAIVSLSRSKH